MRPVPALLVLAALATASPAAEKNPEKASDPGPDAAYALTLLNAHRADRLRADNRVTVAIKRKQVPASLRDWSLSTGSNGESLPPLVFNPSLNEAAAKLLASGSRAAPGQRSDAAGPLSTAGYPSPGTGAVLLAGDAGSAELAVYAALAISIGSVERPNHPPLPLLARSDLLKAAHREVGIAVGGGKAGTSIAIVLGGGSAKRHLGGLVYQDLNHNGAYDPGEGRGGVAVSAGPAATTTLPSGAWWLALDHQDAVEVRFQGEGATTARALAKGAATAWIDWRTPIPADCKNADRLIAAAEKAGKDAGLDKQRGPLAELLTGTRLACLDDERQKRVEELAKPIQVEFQDTLSGVLAALGEDPAGFRKRLGELQKPWKGAMPAWFREAQGLYALRQKVVAAQAAPAGQQARLAAQVIPGLQQAIKASRDPAFLDQLRLWQDDLEAIVNSEDGEASGKDKKKKP